MTQEEIAEIVKVLSTVLPGMVDQRIEEFYAAQIVPVLQELAQRDELVEQGVLGRLLATDFTLRGNDLWKRYIMFEAERYMAEDEVAREMEWEGQERLPLDGVEPVEVTRTTTPIRKVVAASDNGTV